MGKIKVHELAKKLNLNSKEVLARAKELNIDVKSHLSNLEEEECAQIEASYKTPSDIGVKQEETKKNKEQKTEKTSGPVIIRREVIVSGEDKEKQKEEEKEKNQKQKENVGFVDIQRKKDFNIVYRNKQTKPMTVNELFGLNNKKAEENFEISKADIETKKKNNEIRITNKNREESFDEKPEENRIKNNYNRNNTQNNHTDYRNNNQNGYFRNNNYRNNNQNGYNNSQNNGYKNNNYRNNNQTSKNNNYNNNFRNNNYKNNIQNGFGNNKKPLDDKGIEKNIKNIMSADIIEKESVREYANKAIDKQKNNRNEEQKSKKQNKNNRK